MTKHVARQNHFIIAKFWIVKGLGSFYFPAPGPLLGPRPWPRPPSPIYIYRPWPRICIYRHWPRICIYRLWPTICVYRTWPTICIYLPWPTILLPVRGLSLHIPTLAPQFVLVFTALVHDLYYMSGA